MIAACTGHRPSKLNNDYMLVNPLSRWIKQRMIEIIGTRRPDSIISRMALGADTLWAMAALEMEVPLIAVVPFKGQEDPWREENKKMYREIISKAAEIKVVGERKPESSVGALLWQGNAYMIDQLTHPKDFLVTVFDGSPGGTYNTILYAGTKEPRIEMVRIDPRDFEATKKSRSCGK